MPRREVRFSPNSHRLVLGDNENGDNGKKEEALPGARRDGEGNRGRKRVHSSSGGDGRAGVVHALLVQPSGDGGGGGSSSRKRERRATEAGAEPTQSLLPPPPSSASPAPSPPPIVPTAQDAVRVREDVGGGVVIEELELEISETAGSSWGPAAEHPVASSSSSPSSSWARFVLTRGTGGAVRLQLLEGVAAGMGEEEGGAGEKEDEDEAQLWRLMRQRAARLGRACTDPEGAVARAHVALAVAAARAAGTKQVGGWAARAMVWASARSFIFSFPTLPLQAAPGAQRELVPAPGNRSAAEEARWRGIPTQVVAMDAQAYYWHAAGGGGSPASSPRGRQHQRAGGGGGLLRGASPIPPVAAAAAAAAAAAMRHGQGSSFLFARPRRGGGGSRPASPSVVVVVVVVPPPPAGAASLRGALQAVLSSQRQRQQRPGGDTHIHVRPEMMRLAREAAEAICARDGEGNGGATRLVPFIDPGAAAAAAARGLASSSAAAATPFVARGGGRDELFGLFRRRGWSRAR